MAEATREYSGLIVEKNVVQVPLETEFEPSLNKVRSSVVENSLIVEEREGRNFGHDMMYYKTKGNPSADHLYAFVAFLEQRYGVAFVAEYLPNQSTNARRSKIFPSNARTDEFSVHSADKFQKIRYSFNLKSAHGIFSPEEGRVNILPSFGGESAAIHDYALLLQA